MKYGATWPRPRCAAIGAPSRANHWSLAHAQQADHFAGAAAGRRHARAERLGDETAVDQHGAAVGQPQRRHHPVAAALLGHRLHQGLALVDEGAAGAHAPVLGIGLGQSRPLRRRGRGHRRRMDALGHLGDQAELPGAALDLPVAQRHQAGDGRRGKQRQRRQPDGRQRARGIGNAFGGVGGARIFDRRAVVGGTGQGRVLVVCMPGIILEFRWNITHSVPVSVITTSTSVKISASMFQPPSDLALRCRK